jgi:hypothetical protein
MGLRTVNMLVKAAIDGLVGGPLERFINMCQVTGFPLLESWNRSRQRALTLRSSIAGSTPAQWTDGVGL